MGRSTRKLDEWSLCCALCDAIGWPLEPISVDVPEATGDAIISAVDQPIVLQLTRYIARSHQQQRQDSVGRFRDQLADAASRWPGPPWLEVLLNHSTDGNGAPKVPPARRCPEVISELEELVFFLGQAGGGECHFVDLESNQRIVRDDVGVVATYWASRTSFLHASEYFGGVMVESRNWLEEHYTPQVDSATLYADVGFARDRIKKKFERLEQYRRGTDDPIWLVLHADGTSVHNRIVADTSRDIVTAVRQEVQVQADRVGDSFERVLFFQNALTRNSVVHMIDQ